jgi:DNA-binding LytR/AlgR family response regulator
LALVAKALQENRPYPLAFVDVRMPPGLDGVETVHRIWQVDPEILVVLCTAYSDHTWEEIVLRLGRTDHLLILKKPFDNIEVRQIMLALTKRWYLARQAALTQGQLEKMVAARTWAL